MCPVDCSRDAKRGEVEGMSIDGGKESVGAGGSGRKAGCVELDDVIGRRMVTLQRAELPSQNERALLTGPFGCWPTRR